MRKRLIVVSFFFFWYLLRGARQHFGPFGSRHYAACEGVGRCLGTPRGVAQTAQLAWGYMKVAAMRLLRCSAAGF